MEYINKININNVDYDIRDNSLYNKDDEVLIYVDDNVKGDRNGDTIIKSSKKNVVVNSNNAISLNSKNNVIVDIQNPNEDSKNNKFIILNGDNSDFFAINNNTTSFYTTNIRFKDNTLISTTTRDLIYVDGDDNKYVINNHKYYKVINNVVSDTAEETDPTIVRTEYKTKSDGFKDNVVDTVNLRSILDTVHTFYGSDKIFTKTEDNNIIFENASYYICEIVDSVPSGIIVDNEDDYEFIDRNVWSGGTVSKKRLQDDYLNNDTIWSSMTYEHGKVFYAKFADADPDSESFSEVSDVYYVKFTHKCVSLSDIIKLTSYYIDNQLGPWSNS